MKRSILKIGVMMLMCAVVVSSVKIKDDSLKAAAVQTQFDFNGNMQESVLHSFLNRAVTFQGLCGEGPRSNLLIKEDIRFLLRTGTKFVSRAAMFAWNSTLPEHVGFHFEEAEKLAAMVHAKDPQIILQAFVAEIVRKSYVDKISIPSWVFEAFGLVPENRNFRFSDIINKDKGPNYWGAEAGYPDYSNLEARLWYYYCIRKYIDAGFESIHIQEGEDQTEYTYVDQILTMSREYAAEKARRGLVLFHNFFSMFTGGNKIGNRLLFDIQGNGIVPIETVYEDGAMKCKIGDYRVPGNELQWLGRSAGGQHPLGFNVDACPTLLEFDNYGPDPAGTPGVSNGVAFYTWGYDDITWFAMQPDWYREEFLRYVRDYLSSHCLDSEDDQVYYCMYPVRRVITPVNELPERLYTPGNLYSTDFIFDYCDASQENIKLEFHEDRSFTLSSKGFYRANRTGDGCPNGFGEEDLIREFFLGVNAPEDQSLLTAVLPDGYAADVTSSSSSSSSSSASVSVSVSAVSSKASVSSGISVSSEDERASDSNESSTAVSTTPGVESSVLSEESSDEVTSGEDISDDHEAIVKSENNLTKAILLSVISILFIGSGATACFLWRKKRKKQSN